MFGNRVRIGPPGPDGRIEVELCGHSDRSLAAEAAGLGAMLAIVDPPSVRAQLATVGAELVALYGPGDEEAGRLRHRRPSRR